MPVKDETRPLWTCPRCGHRFVTRNMWHSCSQVKLEEHFQGRDVSIRKLFDAWLAFIEKHGGPVTVIPQKTRISFQVRVRFAGATIRKNWVECGLWLKRKVDDPRFERVEVIPPRNYVYHFRLTEKTQLDKTLAEYVKEAYEVGKQNN